MTMSEKTHSGRLLIVHDHYVNHRFPPAQEYMDVFAVE